MAALDSDDRIVLSRAVALTSGSTGPDDAAMRIFSYVRDSVLFDATLDIRLSPAEVLRRRIVDYCNKINLHVSLLRAVGIGARFHMVKVAREALKPVVPSFMYRFLPSPVGHFFCECHLNGRWIACEALYDTEFYRGLLRLGHTSLDRVPTIEWDGTTDCVVLKNWMVEDDRTTFDYTEIIKQVDSAARTNRDYRPRRRTNAIRHSGPADVDRRG